MPSSQLAFASLYKRTYSHVRRLTLERLEDRSLLAGDMVLQWNEVLLDAIRADRTAPPLAARNMAIVHVAIYDAVNAIEQTHEPFAVNRRAPPGASAEAAVATAAHQTLVDLFPDQQATFNEALASSLATIPDGPAENKGVALGRSVAHRILALRQNDGADESVEYTIGTEPGDWQPTPPAFLPPLLPQWPYVKPFAMASADQFRPPPPPALSSEEYAAAFQQVQEIGAANSATRTTDETEIAWFWVNGPGTATPPGHWNEVAQVVAQSAGNTLAENARLFALLNIAVADAGISCWDAKYEFNFWRPVTAIRAADTDGNPDTEADPAWSSLIPTPPFGAYTSGHSTFSAAAAAVLAGFFGDDAFAFTLPSETPAAGARSYGGFWQAAEESGISRIYGGIHWSFDNDQALMAGKALGAFVYQHKLQPIHAGLLTDLRAGALNLGDFAANRSAGRTTELQTGRQAVPYEVVSSSLLFSQSIYMHVVEDIADSSKVAHVSGTRVSSSPSHDQFFAGFAAGELGSSPTSPTTGKKVSFPWDSCVDFSCFDMFWPFDN